MKKPSASSGETVKELIPGADSVRICFVDGKSITVSMGAYLDGPRIYPGKKLDKATIAALNESKEDIGLYSYLLSLLSSGRLYSRKKLVEKMMMVKKASYQQANETVLKAVQQGIINDDDYVREYIIAAHDLGQSKEKILMDLSKEGYSSTSPREFYISLGLDDNTQAAVSQAVEKAHGRNIQTIAANAAIRLVRLGYSYEKAEEEVSRFIASNSGLRARLKARQEVSLKAEYEEIYRRFIAQGDNPKEAKMKTAKRLLARKYEYNDIVKEAEEHE